MNVINNNEELIMDELIRIEIISNPYEIGGLGATRTNLNFLIY